MLQLVLQQGPPAADAGFGRAQPKFHDRRDLLVRPTFDVPEHDWHPVLFRQRRDRACDHLASLVVYQLRIRQYPRIRRLKFGYRVALALKEAGEGKQLSPLTPPDLAD